MPESTAARQDTTADRSTKSGSATPISRIGTESLRQVGVGAMLAGALLILLAPKAVQAAGGDMPDWSGGFDDWLARLREEVASPLFWFGMGAQGMFFLRFLWQWIVSERRHHSTVPIAFWYFSLAGGVAMFIYACLLPATPIMLGQAMACLIYARNLMLIYGQAARRKRAGLPHAKLRSEVSGEAEEEEAK